MFQGLEESAARFPGLGNQKHLTSAVRRGSEHPSTTGAYPLAAAAEQYPTTPIPGSPCDRKPRPHDDQRTGCCQPISCVISGQIAKAISVPQRIQALHDAGPFRAGDVLTWRDDAAGGAWWTADGRYGVPALTIHAHYGRDYGPAPAEQLTLLPAAQDNQQGTTTPDPARAGFFCV